MGETLGWDLNALDNRTQPCSTKARTPLCLQERVTLRPYQSLTAAQMPKVGWDGLNKGVVDKCIINVCRTAQGRDKITHSYSRELWKELTQSKEKGTINNPHLQTPSLHSCYIHGYRYKQTKGENAIKCSSPSKAEAHPPAPKSLSAKASLPLLAISQAPFLEGFKVTTNQPFLTHNGI